MEECEICGGSGIVKTDVYDEDSHQYEKGTGSMKCVCQIKDEDMSGATEDR